MIILSPEWPAFADETYQLDALVGLRQFDFLVWELEAIGTKTTAVLGGNHTYLDEEAKQAIVLEYLDLVHQTQQLDRTINDIYVDPAIGNPEITSSDLRRQLTQIRADLVAIQPIAEAIVQEQVADILVDEGFGVLGQVSPPVLMHMTPLPSVLIVSPRDRIERTYQYQLVHGLPTSEHHALETTIYESLGLSALVVPIGGLGTYPSMIMETANINWLLEVTAHEWAHIWLGFKPLGLYYGLDPQVRTINETAVSIFDEEIATQVIAHYYPEFMPSPPTPPAPQMETVDDIPPPFDFQAEMAETRVTVDQLLADGEIDAAEAYMEARRRYMVDNGYNIRKLNQAYFAFYGAYAATPGGASGEDPIGPLLRQIRANSPSLRAFMDKVAPITSFADLQMVAEQ